MAFDHRKARFVQQRIMDLVCPRRADGRDEVNDFGGL